MGAMRRMISPFWNSRTVPFDWLTTTARALVTSVIAAAAQWRRAQPFGQGQPGHGCVDEPAGRFHRAVACHHECSVELGDLLDRLAHAEVADVSLLAPVSLERVEAELSRSQHHVAGIADDDQGSDWLFPRGPSRPISIGDVHDCLERLERDRGLQCPQIARGEPFEVFAQPDHGERVELLGLEARVDHHDPSAGLELVVGHGLDQGQADPFGDRHLVGLDLDRDQTGFADRLELALGVAGDQDRQVAGAAHLDQIPVHRPFGDDQHADRSQSPACLASER